MAKFVSDTRDRQTDRERERYIEIHWEIQMI